MPSQLPDYASIDPAGPSLAYQSQARSCPALRRVWRNHRRSILGGLIIAAALTLAAVIASQVSTDPPAAGSKSAVSKATGSKAAGSKAAGSKAAGSRSAASAQAKPWAKTSMSAGGTWAAQDNVDGLLNLTWPRRDNEWYRKRWDNWMANQNSSSKSRTKRSTVSNHSSGLHQVFGNLENPKDSAWLHDDGSTFPQNDTFHWSRDVKRMEQVSAENTRSALAYAASAAPPSGTTAGEALAPDTPAYRHQKLLRLRGGCPFKAGGGGSDAADVNSGMYMEDATKWLSKRLNLTREETTMDTRWLADMKRSSFCPAPKFSKKANYFILMNLYYVSERPIEVNVTRNPYTYRPSEVNNGNMVTKTTELTEIVAEQVYTKGVSSEGTSATKVSGEQKHQLVHQDCTRKLRYRTYDGTCNNLQRPTWGSANTAFRRTLPASYGDGVSTPRESTSGGPLPGPKTVSRGVLGEGGKDEKDVTVLTTVWGQLLAHDLSVSVTSTGSENSALNCCPTNTTELHYQCLSIYYQPNQTYNLNGTPKTPAPSDGNSTNSPACMNFVRSAAAPSCHLGPRDQVNGNTAFLDGSEVYGADATFAKELRQGTGGLLAVQTTLDGRELLSPDMTNDTCNTVKQAHYNRFCFKSGDARSNENVMLTGVLTVLAREHNALARGLANLNPHWGDERLYQEARRVVVAEMQHITYEEYLPVILGPRLTKGLGLTPATSGYWHGYDPDVNPGIANAFTTAAYRFGHSMIQGIVQTITADGRDLRVRQLRRVILSPFELYDPATLGRLVRGAANQRASAVDPIFTPQVTRHLLESPRTKDGKPGTGGLDLPAINIQRGRDHGLAPYVRWRMVCGLSPVSSFEELKGEMDPIALRRMAANYRDVADVDLYAGGLAETPLPGAVVGPTFACVIADQFLRLKKGDRLWYETGMKPQAFSAGQLKTLRHSSLAALLCRQVEGMLGVQRWPLRPPGPTNPRLSCLAFDRLDLTFWEED